MFRMHMYCVRVSVFSCVCMYSCVFVWLPIQNALGTNDSVLEYHVCDALVYGTDERPCRSKAVILLSHKALLIANHLPVIPHFRT